MSDPVKAIANRIRRRCGALAVTELRQSETDPWRSLLFDGGRHRIELSLQGADVEAAIDALRNEIETPDFAIPGHLIAEIGMTGIHRGPHETLVRLDAMTIAS